MWNGPGDGPDRLPVIPPELLNDAQCAAIADFQATRGGPVFGPFVPMLRSPGLMRAVSALGAQCRYRSSLPHRLNEFVILITAAEWRQAVEWQIHYPIAIEAGLPAAVADAVAERRRPDGMSEDEAIVWQFSTELHRDRAVSDATYARALARFGEAGVVDLTGVNGYYALLAMMMNMARTQIPADGSRTGQPNRTLTAEGAP